MKLAIWRAGLPLFLSTLMAAVIVSAVHANGFIDRFDRDQDGVVTMDEFPGPDRIFDKIDSDGDGIITETEAAAAPRPGRGGQFFIDRFDQDGDGLVSLEEFPRTEALFAMLDADGDGYISEDETPPPPPRGERDRSRE